MEHICIFSLDCLKLAFQYSSYQWRKIVDNFFFSSSKSFLKVSQIILQFYLSGPFFVQVSRIIFPMGFAVFNISYWVYYLHIIAVSNPWSCLQIGWSMIYTKLFWIKLGNAFLNIHNIDTFCHQVCASNLQYPPS